MVLSLYILLMVMLFIAYLFVMKHIKSIQALTLIGIVFMLIAMVLRVVIG